MSHARSIAVALLGAAGLALGASSPGKSQLTSADVPAAIAHLAGLPPGEKIPQPFGPALTAGEVLSRVRAFEAYGKTAHPTVDPFGVVPKGALLTSDMLASYSNTENVDAFSPPPGPTLSLGWLPVCIFPGCVLSPFTDTFILKLKPGWVFERMNARTSGPEVTVRPVPGIDGRQALTVHVDVDWSKMSPQPAPGFVMRGFDVWLYARPGRAPRG